MNKNNTKHDIVIGAAQKMQQINNESIELVVTSPPYPMIEMWDDIMSTQNPMIRKELDNNNGLSAFELMHLELDKVWAEVERVLVPGGFACINIGDATRTINKQFSLYPNHPRIILAFQKLGFSNLPNIIWRKQTNAPNKFMGSGMLPSGAYVTLEHEWILIFRKGNKRTYKSQDEKIRRRLSSFFWEERNIWFSDIWELKGIKQKIHKSETRKRSAAYPFEIPYRLINMYSMQNDTVLDPFLGTGTTTLAAMALKRNSIGYEIDPQFLNIVLDNIENTRLDFLNSVTINRIIKHKEFIDQRKADESKNEIKHFNEHLQIPVMTRQETSIEFNILSNIETGINSFTTYYNLAKPVEIIKQIKADKQLDLFD